MDERRHARGDLLVHKSPIVTVLLSICAALAFGACGGTDKDVATLPIRVEGTPEMKILAQIYGRALAITGYEMKNVPPGPGNSARETMDELKAGRIAGYPQHLSTSLALDLFVPAEGLPADPHVAYERTKKGLEKNGLTVFPPTPFGIANVVAMQRKTAEKYGLETDSDLKGKAEQMTLKAPTYCHLSLDCLGGIEWHYGTAFEGVSYEKRPAVALTWSRPEPAYLYEVLEDGEVDASMVFNTDGRLARDKFVALEDDKHAFPAGNVVWVTSHKVVDEAGPDYEKTIVAAQKGLTLEVMRQLNAKVELEGGSPATVAAEYLKAIHFEG